MDNTSLLHLTSVRFPVRANFKTPVGLTLYLLLIAALYLASYESEGPENHIEKDRWKTLRFVSEVTHINK